jgi:hypothetical protein
MQLWRVFLKTILLSVIFVLVAYGLHLYLAKSADDRRLKNAQTAGKAESVSEVNSPVSSEQPLPPVEPPKPAIVEIIKPETNHSELAQKAKESLSKKDYKTAAELCGRLAEKDSKAFLCVGMSHFMLGDYGNAVTFLEKAFEGRADEFTCRKYLAFAYYYIHNSEKSLLNAEKGLGIKKDRELEVFHARLLRESRRTATL